MNYTLLDRKCSLMLSFDVANLVLGHISGASFHDEVFEFDECSVSLDITDR